MPFSACSPASANPTPAPASRCVASSTSTVPGPAAACTRAAVFTASPATIPSPTAPRFTATSPVTTPHRAAKPATPASAPRSATPATRSSPARTARSASPSAATGVPHTAITASPMNFSTTPPYRPTTVRARSKYSDSSSRTASGSRASDNGVNPTRSQNSTEHTRRSATGPAAAGAKTPGLAATASAAPHSPQNFWPGELAVPHEAQTSASAAPHSPQNFWPEGLSAEHRGHIILGEGYRSPAGTEKASKATGSLRAQVAREDCPGNRAAGPTPPAGTATPTACSPIPSRPGSRPAAAC